jgi:hypothetical protein
MSLTTSACGGPPQIVDYSPQRGAVDVSTAAPIQIIFDHDVDQASVESRLHLVPGGTGAARWPTARQLVYDHETLRANTPYEVVLEPGYRDHSGNVYTLRHHWSFVTEGPPSLASSTPANADAAVDPAAYLAMTFTRAMQLSTLKNALTISPAVPFDVRVDPADNRRAIIAPSRLLTPNQKYVLQVGEAALDVDGNAIDRGRAVTFTTGPVRPLHGWITFTTSSAGSAAGLWLVNESGFPRQLFDNGSVKGFSWAPAGDSLLVQQADDSWATLTPGLNPTPLTFQATWAATLARGMGLVYIDSSRTLRRQTADGRTESIASDVAEAKVSPNGLRVAYVPGRSSRTEIWGYDVGLRASYQLATDTAPVSNVTWAPAGNRIAYLRADTEMTSSLRIRNLTGTAATTTVATGPLGAPAWFPDSTHVVFAAALARNGLHKAFVINVVAPPATINPAAGLPGDATTDVYSPVPSPDGHQIAFLSEEQVWLMNADGTRPTALTSYNAGSFPYSCRALAWTRT